MEWGTLAGVGVKIGFTAMDFYLAKRLDILRPDEASAARVLRELVENQRLG